MRRSVQLSFGNSAMRAGRLMSAAEGKFLPVAFSAPRIHRLDKICGD
jgi:hypothetical protein